MTMHSSTFYCLLPPRRPIRATKKTTSFPPPFCALFANGGGGGGAPNADARSGTLAKNGGRFSKLIMSKSFFGRRKKLSCSTTSTSLSTSIPLSLSIYLSIYLSVYLSRSLKPLQLGLQVLEPTVRSDELSFRAFEQRSKHVYAPVVFASSRVAFERFSSLGDFR